MNQQSTYFSDVMSQNHFLIKILKQNKNNKDYYFFTLNSYIIFSQEINILVHINFQILEMILSSQEMIRKCVPCRMWHLLTLLSLAFVIGANFSINFQPQSLPLQPLQTHQHQPLQPSTNLPDIPQPHSQQNLTQIMQPSLKQSPNRHLQDSSTQNQSPVVRMILLVIIIGCVSIPVLALLIFGVTMCIRRYRGIEDDEDGEEQSPPSDVQISLEKFNIDQIGPFYSNPNDNCPICLDNSTNIRTFCGHFFHGQCLKGWFDKKSADRRSPTCPVCISKKTNPVKIYCKKCSMSGKLDVIYVSTSQEKISQLGQFKCGQCGKQRNRESVDKDKKNNNGNQNEFQASQEPIGSDVKLSIDSSM